MSGIQMFRLQLEDKQHVEMLDSMQWTTSY